MHYQAHRMGLLPWHKGVVAIPKLVPEDSIAGLWKITTGKLTSHDNPTPSVNGFPENRFPYRLSSL